MSCHQLEIFYNASAYHRNWYDVKGKTSRANVLKILKLKNVVLQIQITSTGFFPARQMPNGEYRIGCLGLNTHPDGIKGSGQIDSI